MMKRIMNVRKIIAAREILFSLLELQFAMGNY